MTQIKQELILSNLLAFNFGLVQDKLKKNFEIISYRLNRLEEMLTLEDRVKTLQKQSKFMNIKIDSISQRLPDNMMIGPQQDDIIRICTLKINQFFMTENKQQMKSTQLFRDLKQTIERSIQQKNVSNSLKKQVKKLSKQQQRMDYSEGMLGSNYEGGIGQIKITDKLTKQHLQKYLNKNQVGVVQKILKEMKSPQQLLVDLALKMQKIQKYLQQQKISKGLLQSVQKDLQKHLTPEQKFARYEKKLLKDQTLKDSRKISRKIIIDDIKNEKNQKNQQQTHQKQKSDQKFIKTLRSSTKFILPDKIQKRLRVEDNRDINFVIKQLQNRIDSKVSKQTFMNFVQDFEQKLQVLKHLKVNHDMSQYKKTINNFQTKIQSIINFLQQVTDEQDPLIVKKKWSCISCDKQSQKYTGKIGNHINWESLNTKKLSPTKAGAFGQTVLFATKIKSIIDSRKIDSLQQ